MTYRATLIFFGFLGVCAGVRADSLSSADEYLDLLEIEIVESVCDDRAFRKEINASWDLCAKKAMSSLGVCTKALHQFAPREDVVNDAKRVSKESFVSMYSDCLKRELQLER